MRTATTSDVRVTNLGEPARATGVCGDYADSIRTVHHNAVQRCGSPGFLYCAEQFHNDGLNYSASRICLRAQWQAACVSWLQAMVVASMCPKLLASVSRRQQQSATRSVSWPSQQDKFQLGCPGLLAFAIR